MTRTDLYNLYGKDLYKHFTHSEKRYLTDRYPQKYAGLLESPVTEQNKRAAYRILQMDQKQITLMLQRRAGIAVSITDEEMKLVKEEQS